MRRIVITRNGWLSQIAASNSANHQKVLAMLFSAGDRISLAEEHQFDVVLEGQKW